MRTNRVACGVEVLDQFVPVGGGYPEDRNALVDARGKEARGRLRHRLGTQHERCTTHEARKDLFEAGIERNRRELQDPVVWFEAIQLDGRLEVVQQGPV